MVDREAVYIMSDYELCSSKQKITLSKDDKIFYSVINVMLSLIVIMILYPLIFIISSSFSSPDAVSSGRVFLWPVDFSLEGYKAVLSNKSIIIGYRNTIFYTISGTFINVIVTLIAAYPLARRNLPYKGILMFLFTFTMLFSGGMIPTYILIKDLKMINTPWAMIIPGAISVYNMIIARTFIMNNIPDELLEASQLDGCSDTRFFFKIVLPLSKAVIAVITLYYAVGHWNSYFSAFLYLNNKNLYPLQIILRDILIASQFNPEDIIDPEIMSAKIGLADLLKYSLIIVSSLPIIAFYPFIQKYFIKGVMIGSLKG